MPLLGAVAARCPPKPADVSQGTTGLVAPPSASCRHAAVRADAAWRALLAGLQAGRLPAPAPRHHQAAAVVRLRTPRRMADRPAQLPPPPLPLTAAALPAGTLSGGTSCQGSLRSSDPLMPTSSPCKKWTWAATAAAALTRVLPRSLQHTPRRWHSTSLACSQPQPALPLPAPQPQAWLLQRCWS